MIMLTLLASTPVAVTARWLHLACTCIAAGTLLLTRLPAAHVQVPGVWRRNARRLIMGALIGAMVSGGLALAAQAAALAAEQGTPFHDVVSRLLGSSRIGHVWLVREALLGLALSIVAVSRWSAVGAYTSMGCALASIGIAPWAGHSGAIEPWWTALPVHALHMAAVAAWLGALPGLLWLFMAVGKTGSTAAQRAAAETLARFSRIALVLMLLIIAAGAWIALVHVERWPALLGTPYGSLLLVKLGLVLGVLGCAVRLRAALLPELLSGRDATRAAAWWLGMELGLAALTLLAAGALAQTVPARHAEIVWPWPFRLSVAATWDLPGVRTLVLGGAGLCACALIWMVIARRRPSRKRVTWVATAAAIAGGLLVTYALAVPANPDTYRRPDVPYQASSVAAGEKLFAAHCTGCHGPAAHGDGPLARGLPLAPADLTEPHTALHTAGDIFWWLEHGKPPGVMPGFSGLGAEQRWNLINYLRALSAGYQARIITEQIVPRRPWLAAIDFGYTASDGSTGSLKDFRERAAVLMVFFTPGVSDARLAQLAASASALHAAGGELLAIPVTDASAADAWPLPTLVEGADEVARSYALLRRTLRDADAHDARPLPAHMEVLVDRFGYVRARWLPEDGPGWSDPDALLRQLAALRSEPRVAPPPDDHVH